MNWWKANMILMFCMTAAMGKAQVLRDTSYTLASTLAKYQRNYPDLQVEGVYPCNPKNVHLQVRNYKSLEERKLPANLFVPEVKKQVPAVMLVHGGGWRAGSPELMTPIAEHLALAGFLVMVPEYRLSLEATYPAAVDDLKDGLNWLKANAIELSIDTTKLAVAGFSAGGQLAALIGTTYPVQAIVDVDGVLAFHHPDSEEGAMAAQWLGGTYEEVPAIWKEASAMTHVNEKTPPTLFLASKYPRFLAGYQSYLEVLDEAGTYSEYHAFDDAPHSFWLVSPWFEPTVNRIIEFLNQVINKTN